MAEYVCSCCCRKCESDGIIFHPDRVAYRCTSCRKIICTDCAKPTWVSIKCPLCDTKAGDGFDPL